MLKDLMYFIYFDKKNLHFCHQNASNCHQNLNIAKNIYQNTVFGEKQLL